MSWQSFWNDTFMFDKYDNPTDQWMMIKAGIIGLALVISIVAVISHRLFSGARERNDGEL